MPNDQPDYSLPSSARVYSALREDSGGNYHYQTDRDAVRKLRILEPYMVDVTRQAVECGHRMVKTLTGMGFDQFVDVGCGLPAQVEVGDLIWQANPEARILNIDNDPSVQGHHRARTQPDERERFLFADIRDLDDVLASPQAELLDWGRPVAWLTLLLWHFIPDASDPAGLLDRIGEASAPGSMMAATHISHQGYPEPYRAEVQTVFDDISPGTVTVRDTQQIAELLGGRRMLEPGIVRAPDWRPEHEETVQPTLQSYAAVVYL